MASYKPIDTVKVKHNSELGYMIINKSDYEANKDDYELIEDSEETKLVESPPNDNLNDKKTAPRAVAASRHTKVADS